MAFQRKTLLSAALLTLTAGLASCSGTGRGGSKNNPSEYYRVLSITEYDYAAMMSILQNPNPHKQVFVTSTLPPAHSGGLFHQRGPEKRDAPELFGHMQVSMNAYDYSLSHVGSSLATLGVLTGYTVIFGLNNAMWQKYSIGSHFILSATN